VRGGCTITGLLRRAHQRGLLSSAHPGPLAGGGGVGNLFLMPIVAYYLLLDWTGTA
jgi:predicted PurR-regulated permease PerM